MGMDKEKLYTYFLSNYLSRQEVLFKLPFSLSIDSFWPELVNRRKAGATVLPLYNAAGMPYWYVLTEKMIAASERLCEEAMRQATGFDPYRAPMTSAMTEEMFFTSFVEGAQIPLQEAMDFLQRGTEPENVQEQMIWNNRQAWSAMVKALYRPLDEAFVKSLAFMLTDEMEGRAEDYRQTDAHPIAAMNDEPFDVPPAFMLQDRMREYYAFLQRPDVHPLIKASAGQGYLLVVRPFPEGNERLSRMISSAVLLRSGYDFFRDISLSSHIARESYRYYKAMRDILRPEHSCDMTYFMEYYLDLLVRALDAKKERDRKREQERLEQERDALARERELAIRPLGGGVRIAKERELDEPCNDVSIVPQTASSLKEQTINVRESTTTKRALANTSGIPVDETTEEAEQNRVFYETLDRIAKIDRPRMKRVVSMLKRLVNEGITTFTRHYWQELTNTSVVCAGDDCFYMMKNGLIISNRQAIHTEYTIAYVHTSPHDKDHDGVCTEEHALASGPYAEMLSSLRTLCDKGSMREKRIAKRIIGFLNNGVTQFTRQDWERSSEHGRSVNRDDLRTAVNKGLLSIGDDGYSIYKRIDTERRFEVARKYQVAILDKLVANFENKEFIAKEAEAVLDGTHGATAYHLDVFAQKGIFDVDRSKNANLYRFTAEYLQYRQRSSAGLASSAEPAVEYPSGMVAAGARSTNIQV